MTYEELKNSIGKKIDVGGYHSGLKLLSVSRSSDRVFTYLLVNGLNENGEYSRQAKGLPIVNLLPIDKGEYVSSIFTVSKDEESKYLVFATRQGLIKRCDISEFEKYKIGDYYGEKK